MLVQTYSTGTIQKDAKPELAMEEGSTGGICISPINDGQNDQTNISDQESGSVIRALVTNLLELLGINRIYRMKLIHDRVNQFLPLMFKEAQTMQYGHECFQDALLVAAERGHVEYITQFCKTYLQQPLDGIYDENEQNLFKIAAECRQHKVYNLMNETSQAVEEIDDFRNNMLHTVGNISSKTLSTINHIQGAALQMQSELQWFKEVESVADSMDRAYVNIDGMTPREVFTKSHKELRKAAEKSMKTTSTSCTVVGALIVTMMFSASFTIPGQNNGDTGLHTRRVFTTFLVSDAISLFSSTTSVIMFLGILTSRYSEEDFLKSLPTKMIVGLFTLFLSIATMMIVFSCGLYIMLDGKATIVIPSILLAGVPVISFIWMQFPLLVELSISTFGRGKFDRNKRKLS
ncbi:uncharacterized protein LOC125469242 [Pyrus x bretschneideri]|uniref:uncharacterized protein LOC125469242 n=1 Tax=Pyrus x bretschneideri TaxID=225117 RepID=UPI00202F0ADC|nr:uncharacterized protein LOC125469242 [Pyrus x bretschneideri]